MKKIIILLLLFIIPINVCYAITEEDKNEIEYVIKETYKYTNHNPIEARNRARKHITNKYNPLYFSCERECLTKSDEIKAKANRNSIFINYDNILQEATQVHLECMQINCNNIKEIQIKECWDYIDEYISKNK